MKYLSFILAIYVFVLTVAPNVVTDECSREQAMDDEQSSKDQHCSDCCSPFTSCNTCTGFTSPAEIIPLGSLITYSDHKLTAFKESSFSEFFPSIWQPPKLS